MVVTFKNLRGPRKNFMAPQYQDFFNCCVIWNCLFIYENVIFKVFTIAKLNFKTHEREQKCLGTRQSSGESPVVK